MCNCDHGAQHSLYCLDTPIFTELAYDMSWSPTMPMGDFPDPFWGHRWVCYAAPEPHVGGYINGFAHWCIRARQWVS